MTAKIKLSIYFRAADAQITLLIWKGMPHVFQYSLGKFIAADRSVDVIGDFLHQQPIATSPSISTPSEI